jgi:hypothetical protein
MKEFKPMLAHVYTDQTQIDWDQPVQVKNQILLKTLNIKVDKII